MPSHALQVHPAPIPNILVIDDNQPNALVASILLEELGCRAQAAASAEEGVEAALRESFDLILLDWRLPGLCGRAAVQALQATPGHADTPIICATAYDEPSILAEIRSAGVVGILHKPCGIEDYQALLTRFCLT